MKRLIVLFCLFTTGFFFTTQYSFAETGAGCGRACKGNNSQAQQQPLDAETKKKYEKFMKETAGLQKEMNEKAAQYQALLMSDNPDPSKAAMLTEEYFQIRNFLEEKAIQAGLVQQRGGCNGCNGKAGVACGLPGPAANVEKTN